MALADPEFDARLANTFRASRYAERMCGAHPGLIDKLRASSAPGAEISPPKPPMPPIPPLAVADTAEGLHAALRARRREVMVETIHRDVNGLADLNEVVARVSALAEQSLAAAAQFHTGALAGKWDIGAVDQEQAALLIVGMGKLGGGELNVSSDIDLVFIHDEDGVAGGERSWHEFHSELGKRIIRALDLVDENGFVFRVDMRLRPFGASGPLVSSLATMENYFFTQARAWERYAWLKARAITGHPQTVRALEAMVRPFVYRRYHDYGAIDEMRDLHGQIRADAAKKNRLDDIKVGVGGIREVEFIAQLFQLIRGGREPLLQTRSTREALSALAAQGIFDAERIAALRAAYTFLRNLEHRLQYLDDQQTQLLPGGEEDRGRIAAAMGYADWPLLLAALNRHRERVTQEFEALFAAQAGTRGMNVNTNGSANGGDAKTTVADEAGLAARCRREAEAAELDGGSVDAIAVRAATWLKASRTQTLSARSRARMEMLMPLTLKAAIAQEISAGGGAVDTITAAITFLRVWDLIEAIDKRETYLALLLEYPAVLTRVTRIASTSAWAAEFLRRHPVLLDELIDNRVRQAAIDWRTERQALRAACDAADGDVERQYEILRHTKQVLTLRLNVADIEGRLGVMALSDDLSALADLLLDTTLVLAWRALEKTAAAGWTPPPGFAILGYGKLGSKELGYASDLDLVFVFDQKAGVTGDRYGRLAQRLNSWLNSMTAGGVLYETDLRLRPDGDAGVIACNLTAFRDYQFQRAWTWEHQALTRARFCAGDPTLASPFEAIRREVLAKPRERAALKAEIVAMRDKMRADKKDRADRLDLKHTRGGMVDVEFIVQYLILAYSHEHPEFLGNLGNFALLTRAAALGIVDEDSAANLGKAYLAYRERQHLARNNNEAKTWIGPDELAAERRAVTRAWEELLG